MLKNLPTNAGDLKAREFTPVCLIGGNGYLLQYSCLENSMDREAWRATVHGVTKNWTRLSRRAHTHTLTPNFQLLPRGLPHVTSLQISFSRKGTPPPLAWAPAELRARPASSTCASAHTHLSTCRTQPRDARLTRAPSFT